MKKDGVAVRFFPEIEAGGFSRIDATVQFYQRINALITPDYTLLDFGAGRGAAHSDDMVLYRRSLQCFKGKVREVIGVDVDPAVITNPSLDRCIVLDPHGPIPLPDKSVDIVIADNAFEHVEDEKLVASELNRILRPGGWICARTPNRYGYIAFANRLIPRFIRIFVLHFVQPSRREEDVFPAFYRLNTVRALRRCFNRALFDHYTYYWDPEPAYYANSKILYGLFLVVRAITPRRFTAMLLVFIRQKADGT
jgi:SAM-dependent methyltransferase